ncbi:MAG TPA: ABC-F family ATP-binding cassette domain-containing protein [Gemmatimonadaceae bacterium]|nr:ABC-F family ATP-binding cassette domain-containing protein [Gemmatimonadaceae bacterium]
MTQIAVSNVAVEYGSTLLFDNVTFTVAAGEKWGIVGRNGTGKTSLVRLLTGQQEPTRGVVAVMPAVRVVLLEQHRDFGEAATVWEAAAGEFAELFALERSLEEQAARIGELGERATEQILDRYARDLERFEREGGYTIAPRVDAVLQGLGFDPQEARTRPLAQLSGGERGRVGLARQLVAPADVVILDEPTNHLDLETTRWLERYLVDTDRTVLLISHDRDFLANVVDHVLHFEGGTATPYVGGYEAFVAQRTERRLSTQRAFERQQRSVAAEEEYIRRNIAGVNSRQAKGRRKRLERLPRLSPPPSAEEAMALRLEIGERGGDQVVVAEHATIAVPDPRTGGERVLVRDLTVTARRGDRIGLIGPNGAGKSTLLKTIVGERAPAAGLVRVGGSVTVAHYRQDLAQVPLDRSLYDVIADRRPQWTRGQIQGHLGRFGFSGDEVQRRAGSLSGGERARVALALMMLSRANLLVLDEPTNHLDVESIEALEDAIEGYEGTVLLVSHDRALLRALATRVWELHDRHVTVFDGSFAEWEAMTEEREHAAAVRAAEAEALRKVEERKRTQRQASTTERDRSQLRQARREVEGAEQRVARAEARVAELTSAMEDPELYTQVDGVQRAAELGRQLDAARAALDAALADWARAEERVEALVAGTA